MYLILLVGLVFVGFAAAFAIRALAYNRVQATERLRSIEMYGFRSGGDGDAADATVSGLNRLAERIGAALVVRTRPADLAKTRRYLLGAGFYVLTPEAYYGYRVLATAGVTVFALLLAISAPSLLMFVIVGVSGLLVWRLPPIFLQRRATERNEEIDRDLPDLMDLLVVSVEAGVGLSGALQMIANRMTGPLGDELRLMIQEQSMGLSSDQSLDKLLDRVDTPAVRSFVRSLQQGERLGVSIGQILRGLAVEMRTRRRQAAEERAQKAPVKILFPLIFLIFPAMFIVLLGPAVFTLQDAFG